MALTPTRMTFQDIALDAGLDVRERVAWLEGRHCHIRVEVTVPGGAPLVVSHEPALHAALKGNEAEVRHKEMKIDVVFAGEKGEEGPQASTVRLLGKHHHDTP